MEKLGESDILKLIDGRGSVVSKDLAKEFKQDHQEVVGVFKSLEVGQYIVTEKKEEDSWGLTAEGQTCADQGTLEYRIFSDVTQDGVPKDDLEKKYGKEFKFGFQYCMKGKWLSFDKTSGKILKLIDSVEDADGLLLKKVSNGEELTKEQEGHLSKRKLIEKKVVKYFEAKKGPKFALEVVEEHADISADMLKSKEFENLVFKPFNLASTGKEISCGSLHPLLKVRTSFREILLELGFEEMPTNNFVENSFWNFDSLFVPQQHPARDQQDTFFVSDPATSKIHDQAYWDLVKKMHEEGGHESIGWRYKYSTEESRRNIFRTHTTCVSSRMLNKFVQEGFRDCKLFSIDRVFRNETLDATHLAEFHQIEGVVCGKNLGLQHLMGIIKEFFRKIGITDIKFKPAYNPYTEPSMEIFCYHPQLKKLIEIGNSGIFRPEMLKPMGVPEGYNVIAWGLSLERPTMINYGIKNIRTLFGPDINVKDMRTNPISAFQ